MLRAALKFYALQKLSFYIGVAALSLLALIISATLSSRGEAVRKQIIHNRNVVKQQSDILNTMLIKYKADTNAWNGGIKDLYLNRSGLDLEFAKERIESLRHANHIKSLSINLTQPATRDDIDALRFTKLIHSRMTINLLAHSDKDVLKFVSSISADLPGVLKFVNMQMTAVDVKGSDQIISSRIELQWQNLGKMHHE